MRKASFRTPPMRRVCALRHQTSMQYSTVEYAKDKAAVRDVSAPAPHSEPVSRLRCLPSEDLFFDIPQVVTECDEICPVLPPKISGNWTERPSQMTLVQIFFVSLLLNRICLTSADLIYPSWELQKLNRVADSKKDD